MQQFSDGNFLSYALDLIAGPETLMGAIMTQPLWLQAWVGWMAAINVIGAVVFIQRPESKWILLAMIGNFILMSALYQTYGYQRILGLAHVVFWTPLLIYLWRRRPQWNFATLSERWLALLFATNLLSLIIDYADVARYLMGERI